MMEKAVRTPHPGLGYKQFVAFIASLMALNAIGVDAMIPALGQIGHDLGAAHPNDRQWVVSVYLLSTGIAQLFYGTLSDRYGRKPILGLAICLYILASLACAFTQSFPVLIALRVIMGIGAAAPRVLAISIIRDCYAGRLMAQVMSFVMLIFVVVPVLAPSLGQIILTVADWRAIFLTFAASGAGVLLWMTLKLPETLHEQDRARIDFSTIVRAASFTLRSRVSLGYSFAIMMIMGCLFGFINSAQQIFTDVFHHPLLFPLCFAIIGTFMGSASLLNATIVRRFGSRLIGHSALLGFICMALLHLAVVLSGHETIWTFTALQAPMMFCFSMLIGNFNAMAMEPMGHIAGAAASIQGFITMVGGASFGFIIGQAFNGTLVPLTLGFVIGGFSGLAATLYAENFRLFKSVQDKAAAFL